MNVYYITIFVVMLTSYLAQPTKKKLLGYKKEDTNNKLFVFITAIMLILVAGLRWRVGTDYWQYSMSYSKYLIILWESIKTFDEPGIKIIAKISSFIYDDYATMFFFSSAITIGLVVLTIHKNSSSFSFSILMYIFTGSWHGSFNGVRQFLAASFVFYGHKYIIEKNFVKYLSLIFVASMFHKSAAIMIFVYFVPKKRLKFKNLIVLILISVVALFSYDYILEFIGNYRYSGKDITQFAYTTRSVSSLRILVAVVPTVFYVLFTGKSRLEPKQFFYVNMIAINAVLAIVTSNSAYLARFVIYTNLFLVLGYPAILKVKNEKFKLLSKYSILLFYFMYWYYEVSITSNLYNFRWIFNR